MTRLEVLNFISTINGWLSSHEGFFLYESALHERKKGEIVEIGSWMGKSTICLAAGSMKGKNAKVTAVDPHKGEYSRENGIGKNAPTFKKFVHNLKKAGVVNWVKPVVATSEDASRRWKKSIRILFIDGLHDYKNTNLDFQLWSPFISEGGIVALHDAFCGHDGPERIILEKILFNNHWNNIGVVGSIIYARKGKITTFAQWINVVRHRLLIPLALGINKSQLPKKLKFILVHRIIKTFLLNSYTVQIQLKK